MYQIYNSIYDTSSEYDYEISDDIVKDIGELSYDLYLEDEMYKLSSSDIAKFITEEYIIRNYNHISDKELEYYYSDKYNIKYDDLDKDRVNYVIFNNVVLKIISNNYNNLTDYEINSVTYSK